MKDSAGCARMLMRWARRVGPASRRDWLEAMSAEVDHLPAAEAPSFAAGCLRAALIERLGSPPFVLAAVRYGLAAAALGWAGLHLRLGLQLGDAEPGALPLPASMFFWASALYVAGAIITLRFGLRAMAVAVLPVLAISALYAAGAGALLQESPHRGFYQALALEEVVALATALLAALIAPRWAQARSSS